MPPSLRSSVWRRHDSTLYSGVANIFVLTPGDLVFVALNFRVELSRRRLQGESLPQGLCGWGLHVHTPSQRPFQGLGGPNH